jgi:hypothetical protein
MRYLSAFAPLAALLVLATTTTTGCDAVSASEPDAPEVQILDGFPHVLPDSIRQDSFRIDTASVDGDLLRLDVSYEGGCAEHAFTLYSSEYLSESLPPHTNTFLSHDAGGDSCTETVREELTFDLSPLKELRWEETLIIGLRPYPTYDGPVNWDQLRYER